MRVLHSSVRWCILTGVCVTASLLKTPGLFSVFWTDVNNAVVWMVSTRPLISDSSNLLTKRLVTVPSAIITIGTTATFMFYSCCFFFNLKFPVKFVYPLFQYRFWIVNIPFVRLVKSKFLAQFPVDHLPHPVVSSLILFQC